MSSLATTRLAEERKTFRRDRPFGFSAKPKTKDDGSTDLFNWECIVPGKDKTYFEGAKIPVTLAFPQDFPARPPTAYMPKGFLHINVFDSGAVCLSILKTEMPEHLQRMAAGVDAWKPGISVKQILLAIQELLHEPNPGSVANWQAYDLWKKQGVVAYEKKMREQAKKYASGD